MAPTGKDKSLLRACFASADGPPVADRGRWLGVGEEWIVFSQVDVSFAPRKGLSGEMGGGRSQAGVPPWSV